MKGCCVCPLCRCALQISQLTMERARASMEVAEVLEGEDR